MFVRKELTLKAGGLFVKAGFLETLHLFPRKCGNYVFSASCTELNQTWETGVAPVCVTKRGNFDSASVAAVIDCVKPTWLTAGFTQQTQSFFVFALKLSIVIATVGLNSPLRLVHEFRNIHKLLWIFFILFFIIYSWFIPKEQAQWQQNFKYWFLNQCSRISSYDVFEITLIIFCLHVNKALDKGTMFWFGWVQWLESLVQTHKSPFNHKLHHHATGQVVTLAPAIKK